VRDAADRVVKKAVPFFEKRTKKLLFLPLPTLRQHAGEFAAAPVPAISVRQCLTRAAQYSARELAGQGAILI
jgi:hypothetical protein